jgi:hypothetical protein
VSIAGYYLKPAKPSRNRIGQPETEPCPAERRWTVAGAGLDTVGCFFDLFRALPIDIVDRGRSSGFSLPR